MVPAPRLANSVAVLRLDIILVKENAILDGSKVRIRSTGGGRETQGISYTFKRLYFLKILKYVFIYALVSCCVCITVVVFLRAVHFLPLTFRPVWRSFSVVASFTMQSQTATLFTLWPLHFVHRIQTVDDAGQADSMSSVELQCASGLLIVLHSIVSY